MKTRGLGLILLALLVLCLAFFFYKKQTGGTFTYFEDAAVLPGSYRGWEPVRLSYKDYSGEPSIDSPLFAEEMKSREASLCSLYLRIYPDLSADELKTRAEGGDAAAMYELYLRLLDTKDAWARDPWLLKAAQGGHLEARLVSYLWAGEIKKAEDNMALIAERYEPLTPFATYVKLVLGRMAGRSDPADLARAKEAGGAWNILAQAVATEIKDSGVIDQELFCEAYYNGCITLLHELKQKHGILCQE